MLCAKGAQATRSRFNGDFAWVSERGFLFFSCLDHRVSRWADESLVFIYNLSAACSDNSGEPPLSFQQFFSWFLQDGYTPFEFLSNVLGQT
jgi:hypothetical protein